MTHTKNNRLGTYTMTLPEFQEIFRGNLRRPPTSSVEVYQWKCRSSKHSLTKLLSLWLPIFFLWCDPFTFASALPLPPATAEGILSTESDVTLYNDYLLADGKLDHVGLNGATDDFQDETQQTTGLDQLSGDGGMRTSPRIKKGLSYLTKYYTEAVLNSSNNNSGSGGATLHHFFTNVGGTGHNSASGEQRIPASIRRKLSFSQPLTSHSLLMTPWSRVSLGRQNKMRLRWGK